MKIEKIRIRNFQCFGPEWEIIGFESAITAFIGGNGTGKTACFQALSRLFGITSSQRGIRKSDFHIPNDKEVLESGAKLDIEVKLGFPELEEYGEDEYEDAIPEFYHYTVGDENNGKLYAIMRLHATWIDDGTSDGSVEEHIIWNIENKEELEIEECKRVQPIVRGSIQAIYVPASRDANSQVTNLLKGRLWQAARWSDGFDNACVEGSEKVQEIFEDEEPSKYIIEKLTNRWQQLNEADTNSIPELILVNKRLEDLVRKADFSFVSNSEEEQKRERTLSELSDGQKSLFHIALASTLLEVEQEALSQSADTSFFEHDKLRRTHLTLMMIEEIENSLSPFFLPRIIEQARDIAEFQMAQVLLSSHSPAILSRIEPQEVRHFRLEFTDSTSKVRKLTLPEDETNERYVRLAVKAYPELYFAKCVILAEGESERLIIPQIASSMGVNLDPSFVPVVPIGGNYVNHFWKLLKKLEIPHVTLLDLDLGRKHGGPKLVKNICELLKELNREIDLSLNGNLRTELCKPDSDLIMELRENGVYFSYPLDIDFSMLFGFPDYYQIVPPNGNPPKDTSEAIEKKKKMVLKSGGDLSYYDDTFDDAFVWYPRLFLNRSKPGTHIRALATIKSKELKKNAPEELKLLVEKIKDELYAGRDEE